MKEKQQSAGVETLIERLRDEGVASGRTEAEKIVGEAQKKAEEILLEARREAQATRETAKREADELKAAGEEAIRLSMRDSVLSLKTEIDRHFTARVRRLVGEAMHDAEFLKHLIVEISRRSVPDEEGKETEFLLPETPVDIDTLRSTPDASDHPLTRYALSLASETLRAGVRFTPSDDVTGGFRARIVEDDVEIELTEEAIAELLLRHTLPRFRAIMEGAVP